MLSMEEWYQCFGLTSQPKEVQPESERLLLWRVILEVWLPKPSSSPLSVLGASRWRSEPQQKSLACLPPHFVTATNVSPSWMSDFGRVWICNVP